MWGVILTNTGILCVDFQHWSYAYVATATSMSKILPKNPGIDFTLPVSVGDTSKEGGGPKDNGCVVR
jgi:hypothetical protein